MEEVDVQLENLNKEFYEQYAEDYETFQYYFRNSYEQRAWEEEISYMCDSLGGEISVLDLGSGTGNLSLKFLSQGCSVTSIDISQKMVEILRAKSTKLGYENCNIFRSSISDFIEQNQIKYDIVCEGSVLHHIDDYLDTVESLASLVKPGGFLYLTREPLNKEEIERSKKLSSVLHNIINFGVAKSIKIFRPFGLLKWHKLGPDHSVIAHHAYKKGVKIKDILKSTKKKGFVKVSLRKWNWRQLSLFSHIENKAFANLRKDEFRRTFWSLILKKSKNQIK